MRFIVGDVGGSNCRLAQYENNELSQLWICPTFQSGGLKGALKAYSEIYPGDYDAGCVAVAGPVTNNSATLTNVKWSGSASDFTCPGSIINDLEAAGHGVSMISEKDISCLQKAKSSSSRKVVIGMGTGHGLSWIFDDKVYATESGHTEFVAASAEMNDFVEYFKKKNGRVRLEDVASGKGISNLLEFAILKYGGKGPEIGENDGAFVLRNQDSHPACEAVIRWFSESCGSIVGDVILRSLASEVWLCGGVSQRWGSVLDRQEFHTALYNKAPMKHIIQSCGINIVMNQQLGLLGAAKVAGQLCELS